MYLGCFDFRGEFGFLNCDDIGMCVVNKQIELLEFVFESVYVDLQYDEIYLTFTAGSVCLCGVCSPVVCLWGCCGTICCWCGICCDCDLCCMCVCCEGDGNAGVGSGVWLRWVRIWVVHVVSGVLASAGDVLEMSVVRGVGEVCDMCMCMARAGGEWFWRNMGKVGYVCVLVAVVWVVLGESGWGSLGQGLGWWGGVMSVYIVSLDSQSCCILSISAS